MITIGIDPGLTGAMAAISSQRGLLDVEDLPTCGNGSKTGHMREWIDVPRLDLLLASWSKRFEFAAESVQVLLERPIAMPRLPAQTIAAQFDTFGAVRALVLARTWGRSMRLVNPREWKKLYGLTDKKDESRACAQRLYPSAPLSRVKDHNRAEAILIAHFGFRDEDAPRVSTRRPQLELVA